MAVCGRCSEELQPDGDFVKCYGCDFGYHYNCSTISEATYRRMSDSRRREWRCSLCKEKGKKMNVDKNKNTANDDLKSIVTLMRNEQKSSFEQLENNLSKLSDFYDDLKSEIMALKESNAQLLNAVKVLERKCLDKESKICELEVRVNCLEQSLRSNNLEMHGVEVVQGEDGHSMFNIVQKIGKELDVPISLNDVELIYRLPKKKVDIVVSFSSKKIRDKLYKNRRKNATLYAKKDEGCPVIKIHSEADL
ncbi:hypothetical protein J437_LFUL015432, partial [Ladona fulva]